MNNAYESEIDKDLDDLDLEEILTGGDEPAKEAPKERAVYNPMRRSLTTSVDKDSAASSRASAGLTSSFGKEGTVSNRTNESPTSSAGDG